MNLKNPSECKLIMNRFKWITNTSFMIVNTEGIEKLIDYSSGTFVEKGINVIPFWNTDDWSESNRYYVSNKNAYLENTCESLKRKYREYKSMYQMIEEPDRIKLYSTLVSSGYNVS